MTSAECQLEVGPIRFDLTGDAVPLRYDRWPYRDFAKPSRESNAEVRTPLVLNVRVRSGLETLPETQPLYSAGQNWSIWTDPLGWVLASGYAARGHKRVHCRLRSDLSGADFCVANDAVDPPLRYPLDQILADILLGRCGGLLLHAAAVERNGMGLVFAGRSGAGKSTLSGLCHDAGWDILNDDRVIVYPDAAGKWKVSGTPWHGSGNFAQNRTLPLQGIFLLHQDPVNRIEPLSLRQARLSLLDVAAIPWFEADWSQASLKALETLTRQIPVQRFQFTRSESAVHTLASQTL